MNFQVNARLLQQCFNHHEIDFDWMAEHLTLDLGHVLLLRDFLSEWESIDDAVLVTLLHLVDAVNLGSVCLDLTDDSFQNDIQKMSVNGMQTVNSVDWNSLKHKQEVALIKSSNYLYFKKYYDFERQLDLALKHRLDGYSGTLFTAAAVNQTAQKVINDLTFDGIETKQVLAIVTSLLQPFSIISGGPGTGKTTIMGSVLRGLVDLGYQPSDIKLAAPTGRAANRMTESLHDVISSNIQTIQQSDQALLQLEAVTLHRLLGAHPARGGFVYGETNQLPCRVLVVDEVSMVDIKLMKQLLQALRDDCRVILLGDQFQLPSVDSGAVLADFMPPPQYRDQVSQEMSAQLTTALQGFDCQESLLKDTQVTVSPQLLTDCYTVLDVSKRSQPNIAEISESIRRGSVSDVFGSQHWQRFDLRNAFAEGRRSDGVYHLSYFQEPKHWFQFCLSWVKQHYFDDELDFILPIKAMIGFDETDLASYRTHLQTIFKTINSNRVLTLVNDSVVGGRIINEQIADLMRSKLAVSDFLRPFHGSVVMLTRNDKNLNLFNGDVAVLLQAKNGQLRAVLPQKGGFVSYSIHVIPEYTSAYAMTVHKSQGSEFSHVLLALPQEPSHRLLTREMVYTGLTRAKKSVVVYGSQAIIEAAIKQQTIRHSGLRFWYNET